MDALCKRLGVAEEEEVDAHVTVRVCLGETMPGIRDARVRALASSMYNRFCPVSPDTLYSLLCNEDVVALNNLLDAAYDDAVVVAPCDDHRVLTCALHDLCPSTVQRMWCDSRDDTRWFSAVYTFESSLVARVATALQSHLFRHAQRVLWMLSHALDTYIASEVNLSQACDDWHVSMSTWVRLRESTTTVGTMTLVVAVSRRHRSAFTCLVASHEWRRDDDDPFILHHRGALCVVLRYARQTFGGVITVEVEESDEVWPAFLMENRLVPPATFASILSSSPCVIDARVDTEVMRRKRAIDVDELTNDRHVRSVVRTWKKSYDSRHAQAPTLTSLAQVTFPEMLTHREFSAHRVHTRTSQHGNGAHMVLVERFGLEYAEGAFHRILEDTVAGFYVVYNANKEAVSTFAILLYDMHAHGNSLACCIDSFAVSTRFQGSGIGGITFHAFLRGICHRVSSVGASYYVFAQCVRTGDARLFWFDKLDESTVARSLLLQAFSIDSRRIPVQLISQCTPRAREYISSDLE